MTVLHPPFFSPLLSPQSHPFDIHPSKEPSVFITTAVKAEPPSAMDPKSPAPAPASLLRADLRLVCSLGRILFFSCPVRVNNDDDGVVAVVAVTGASCAALLLSAFAAMLPAVTFVGVVHASNR